MALSAHIWTAPVVLGREGNRHEVYHFWSCENCDHEIEMVVDVRINAVSKRSESRLRSLDEHSLHIGREKPFDSSTRSLVEREKDSSGAAPAAQ
jgi:hypothetical protein